MHTWAMFSGGAGSGVYVSKDTGATWTRLSRGLPNSPVGKIDVAVAGGAEFRPTDASMQTLAELERDLATARLAYQKLLETDVNAFNALMGSRMKVIMN